MIDDQLSRASYKIWLSHCGVFLISLLDKDQVLSFNQHVGQTASTCFLLFANNVTNLASPAAFATIRC